MTTSEPSLPVAYDVLGSPEPPARRGRASGLGVALVAAGAVAVAGSAVAAAAFLGGGGAQPEDVLPADALGLVKLDLDPAAGQKIAVYRLAERFPTTAGQVEDEDSVKDQLLSALFAQDGQLDYDRDVRPWIGDRAARRSYRRGGLRPGARPVAAEDLRALLGDETVVGVLGEQDFVLLTRSDDPDATQAAWQKVTSLASGGGAAMLRRTEDGVAVGSNPEALQRLESDSGLGESEAFRTALPTRRRPATCCTSTSPAPWP